MKLIKIISFMWLVFFLFAFHADEKTERITVHSLFKIERSKDANQIHYEVNIDATGELNSKNPISIYWVKNTKGGKIEPLTWIQKKYAYGLKFLHVNNEFATFQFVSYNKITFTMKKIGDKHYEVYAKYHDKLIELDKIFIQIDGGTFWFPNISEIKIFAKDVKTHQEVVEVINP